MSADDVSAMSADDLELLRMAARAIGELPDTWVDSEAYFSGVLRRWNPLTDDGDAMRLAVDLGVRETLVLIVGRSGVHCEYQHPYATALASVSHDGDPCAATRRAIVRAAAEVGRDMP